MRNVYINVSISKLDLPVGQKSPFEHFDKETRKTGFNLRLASIRGLWYVNKLDKQEH